jgi:UDP-N-acetylmuramoyl-L-alanyl-D-glutamate--2,6-diaminopimelate ligase
MLPATHTTADPLALNTLLSEMVASGCNYCFMEVSSHAIVQKRISGLHFRGGVFTNLTHDHLDYHKDFSSYLNAKKAFFDQMERSAFALTNTDDKNGKIMVQNTRAGIKTYSLTQLSDYRASLISNTIDGLQLKINNKEIWFKLIGRFNAYNLLASYATACLLDQDSDQVLTLLSGLNGADGRFEIVKGKRNITGIIDYAHTPDALKNVLSTVNQLRSAKQRLITVVGAGGDRDKSKRPVMAGIAAQFSDKVILTSDNPRSEDPEVIINDMIKGIDADQLKRAIQITNRREAIKTATMLAGDNDIIVVAGKGHEKYQEIDGIRHPFDDLKILSELLTDKNMN